MPLFPDPVPVDTHITLSLMRCSPPVQYGGDGRQYAAGGLPNPPQWGYEEEGYGGGYGEDEEGELDNRAG